MSNLFEKKVLNVDHKNQDSSIANKYDKSDIKSKAQTSGVGDKSLFESSPEYITNSGDREIRGTNNTSIILSRDRPGNRLSGYSTHTQSGAIDIVVGRLGGKAKRKSYVEPDFKKDSARVYISQKTDIDNNFSLVDGRVGNKIASSGIAIKADGIRIIGREGIKLVTELNGATYNGIDIIANNDDSDMQPMVKGNNLVESLEQIIANLEELSGIVSTILSAQMEYNMAIATHFHYSPFFGIPTTPSEQLFGEALDTSLKHLTDGILKGLISFKTNIVATKNNYLSPAGAKYINSSYNNVN